MTRVKLRAYLRAPSLVVLFWELAGGIMTVFRRRAGRGGGVLRAFCFDLAPERGCVQAQRVGGGVCTLGHFVGAFAVNMSVKPPPQSRGGQVWTRHDA